MLIVYGTILGSKEPYTPVNLKTGNRCRINQASKIDEARKAEALEALKAFQSELPGNIRLQLRKLNHTGQPVIIS
ncbi:MAG: hypothetical protein N4A74_20605 [Carboxylicivirga sp.]|jgi:hypothetical protein|nr:hypothetical protein [Carboxylicivirga sp.]